MFLNGRLTLGENIGDHAGIAIAFDACQIYVKDVQGGKAPVIDGLTGEQRFFMGWAQGGRTKMLEQESCTRAPSDPHSPGEFRVNAVVRNTDAWYKAFEVKRGNKLYLPPEQRVRMW